ncbi:MAG: hypothetical protein WAU77_08755 [Solirubrobacteraceae bacterium]
MTAHVGSVRLRRRHAGTGELVLTARSQIRVRSRWVNSGGGECCCEIVGVCLDQAWHGDCDLPLRSTNHFALTIVMPMTSRFSSMLVKHMIPRHVVHLDEMAPGLRTSAMTWTTHPSIKQNSLEGRNLARAT